MWYFTILLTGAGGAKDTLDDLLGDLLEDGRWIEKDCQLIMFLSCLLTTKLGMLYFTILLTGAGGAKDTLDDLLGDLLEDGRWLFICCFTSQVSSYGHGGTVSSPNHTFSWASLNKQLTSTSCTYFRL